MRVAATVVLLWTMHRALPCSQYIVVALPSMRMHASDMAKEEYPPDSNKVFNDVHAAHV